MAVHESSGGDPVVMAALGRWRAAALPWVLAAAIVLVAVELQRGWGNSMTAVHCLSLALLSAAWIGTLWRWDWALRSGTIAFDAALLVELAGGVALARGFGDVAGTASLGDLLAWAPVVCAWWTSCYQSQLRRTVILATVFYSACIVGGALDADHAVDELLQGAMMIALVTVFSRSLRQPANGVDPHDFDTAMHDSLTNVVSRAYFEAELAHTAAMSDRYQQPFSLLVVNIDGYTDYCRNFGADEGVRMVRAFAWVIAERIRRSDTVCRWQDETFVVLLPFTHHAEALKLVDTLRPAVAGPDIGARSPLNVRFGVAEHVPGEDALLTFDLAERAMNGQGTAPDESDTALAGAEN